MASNSTSGTFYDILEVSRTSTALDIKKAYRKLALKHHPDRNQGSVEAKTRFQQVAQAYECLGDERKRAEYDAMLRGDRPNSTSIAEASNYAYQGYGRRPVDPFQQFNHLFHTDLFFQEAFQDLDDEFARNFRSGNNNAKANSHTSAKESWGGWLLRKAGVQLQMTSYTSDGSGGMVASHYSSANDAKKTSRTYVDSEGRKVTIRQMQQHGNSIQDKIVDGQILERRINGKLTNVTSGQQIQ